MTQRYAHLAPQTVLNAAKAVVAFFRCGLSAGTAAE
jgi:hypothetical protein